MFTPASVDLGEAPYMVPRWAKKFKFFSMRWKTTGFEALRLRRMKGKTIGRLSRLRRANPAPAMLSQPRLAHAKNVYNSSDE